MTPHRCSNALAGLIALGLLLFCMTAPAHTVRAAHVIWARDLVANVSPERNAYGADPTIVAWAGVNGATEYENRSTCATFLMGALKQAYGLTDGALEAWMGSARPMAAHVHDVISAENGFWRVLRVSEIAPGDILAVRYPEGGRSTGHVALVAGRASLRAATPPLVAGTTQYELEIIDSSKSGHGPTDTRRRPDGSWHQGVGAGVLRLYGDQRDNVVGYTWSTAASSVFYPLSARHLVVGRLR